MQEKDEFSDIMLEEESDDKTSKVKKIAIYVAIFLLIFIVVLVIMKLLNSSDDTIEQKQFASQENTKIVQQKKDDPLFKEVPIEKDKNKKESFDEWVNRLREKEKKKEQAQKEADTKVKTDKTKVEKVAENIPIKKVEPAKQPDKTDSKNTKPATKTKSVANKKKIPTIPVPKSTAKTGNVYIQVLATTKPKPDASFIKKVKAKKYPYRLYNVKVNGTPYVKVLVGPYKNRSQAKNSLAKVRKTLNPKAFIFVTK